MYKGQKPWEETTEKGKIKGAESEMEKERPERQRSQKDERKTKERQERAKRDR